MSEGPNVDPDWFDWLPNGSLGIEFGFEDEAHFLALNPRLRGSRSLILTQIYFYGTFPGISPYQGELPFGLFLSDNRSQVRQKLRT